MAATNFTPIQLYFSTTASAVPVAANLAQGELAINITDGKLYYEDNGGVVQVIATKGTGTIGGSTTQIQYNNAGALAGNAAMVFNNSTNVTTLTTLNLTNVLGAIYGGTAQSTYTQGDVLYASAANTLSKLGIGTVNYILTSSGSVPQWSAPSSISVLTATNLDGGAAGSVPYQSGVATTTFLAIGAANRVMTSTGSAPQWVTALTGLTGVSSSSITNTSLTSGRVVVSTTAGLQADDADLTFDGTTLSAGGFSTVGLSTLVKTVKIGDSSFNGVAVFAAATPAKLYMGTGTVTDVTSAISATNAIGAIASLGITPIAATNTSVTYTDAATLYIAGAPSAGTNVTLTNPYSLYVAAGAAYFGGAVTVAGSLSLAAVTVTSLTDSGLTSGRVTYAGTGGLLQDSANLTFNGTTLTANTIGAFTLGGTVSGGGNQINNVVIGTLTPLAGSFTTVSATGAITSTVTSGVFFSNSSGGTNSTQLRLNNTGGDLRVGIESSVGGVIQGGTSAYAAVFGNSNNYPAQIVSNNAVVGSFSSTGLAVTGTLSSTLGATIQGLTVGLGAGAVATNTAVGVSALAAVTIGANNSASGYFAGKAITDGGLNTAFGSNALLTLIGNNANSAFGANAGKSTTAGNNTFVGSSAGFTNSTGAANVSMGAEALYLNDIASNNTAVGYQAGYGVLGTGHTYLGYQAGFATASGSQYNMGVGHQSLYGAGSGGLTGIYNTAIGSYRALYNNTTGTENTAVGMEALLANTSGSNNVAIGKNALNSAQTVNLNVAVGFQAGLGATTAGNSVFVGSYAGYTGNGDYGYNTFVGHKAGYNNVNSSGGYGNTFVGGNSATGNGSGYAMTTGSNNVILGGFSGNSGGLDMRTANGYIVLSDGDGNIGAFSQSNTNGRQLNSRGSISAASGAAVTQCWALTPFSDNSTLTNSILKIVSSTTEWQPVMFVVRAVNCSTGAVGLTSAWWQVRTAAYNGGWTAFTVVDSGGDTGSFTLSISDATSGLTTQSWLQIRTTGGETRSASSVEVTTYGELLQLYRS